jgi:ubiquitin carboxyl-terminal hydrolase 14
LCKKGWIGTLKELQAMNSTKLANGATITVVGNAVKLAAVTEKVMFVEDLPKEELASKGVSHPPGLANGKNNICYMNATLQALKGATDLEKVLITADLSPSSSSSSGAAASTASVTVSKALQLLLKEMASKTEEDEVFPAGFLAAFRLAHPMFAEVGPMGVPRMQDAEECQSALLNDLAQSLGAGAVGTEALDRTLSGSGRPANVIDSLFGIELSTTLKCDEAEGEPVGRQQETQWKLVCNIQGGAGSSMKINYMTEGLKLGLEGSAEKRSEQLGRNALWTKTSKISRLPKYLTVQFMRFYWRANKDAKPGEPAGTKYKIKRSVAFPANGLDMFEFCDASLQERLSANRERAAKAEAAAAGTEGSTDAASSGERDPKRLKHDDGEDELAKAIALSMSLVDGATAASSSSGAAAAADTEEQLWGLPKDFQGLYELYAVVSHSGASAESGHYVAWVRQGEPGSGCDDWLNFDDETVAPCKTEHVLALKGTGSDSDDIAYVVFFRAVK